MRCRALAVRAAADGSATRLVGSLTDVTAQRELEEKLRYSAHHDALTGLPNRTLFLDRLTQALARTRTEPPRPHRSPLPGPRRLQAGQRPSRPPGRGRAAGPCRGAHRSAPAPVRHRRAARRRRVRRPARGRARAGGGGGDRRRHLAPAQRPLRHRGRGGGHQRRRRDRGERHRPGAARTTSCAAPTRRCTWPSCASDGQPTPVPSRTRGSPRTRRSGPGPRRSDPEPTALRS